MCCITDIYFLDELLIVNEGKRGKTGKAKDIERRRDRNIM